jgi:hypothetical protein
MNNSNTMSGNQKVGSDGASRPLTNPLNFDITNPPKS